MAFVKATKKQAKLRMALTGPSGSGKTYSALAIAKGLGGKIAVIDTEHGSASKYADRFDFDTCPLTNYNPENYIKALREAAAGGYAVVIIDSLTHAWNGTGGVLEIVDAAAAKARGNTYAGWKEGTPAQNALIEAILQSPCHVIATMRAKTEYALEKDERTGKTAPRKIGLAPVQRDGMEYEFDISGFLDVDHNFCIDKSRMAEIAGQVIKKPGEALGQQLAAWLSDGVPEATPRPALAAVPKQPEPADIPTGEPTEAEKVAARFAECQSLDDAKKLAADANANKAKYGDDFISIVKPAALKAIQRLQSSATGAA